MFGGILGIQIETVFANTVDCHVTRQDVAFCAVGSLRCFTCCHVALYYTAYLILSFLHGKDDITSYFELRSFLFSPPPIRRKKIFEI